MKMGQTREEFIFTQEGLEGIVESLAGVSEKVVEVKKETKTWQEIVKEAAAFQSAQLAKTKKTFEAVKASIEDVNKANKKAFEEGRITQDEYNKSIERTKSELESFEKQLDKITSSAKKTENQSGKLNEKIIELRKSLNNYNAENAKIEKGTVAVEKAQKSLIGRITGLITKVGGLVAVFTFLYKSFKDTETGANIIDKVFAGLGAVVSTLTNRVGLLLSSVANLFSGEFTQAGEDFKNVFSGITEEVKGTYNATLLLNQAIKDYEQSQVALSISAATVKIQLDQQLAIANNLKKSTKERLEAQSEANALQKQFNEFNLKAEKELLRAKSEALSLTSDTAKKKELQKEINEGLVRVIELEGKLKGDILKGESAILKIEEQRRVKAERANKARLKEMELLERAQERLNRRLEGQLNSFLVNSLEGEEQIAEQRKQALESVKIAEKETKDRIAELRKLDEAKANALQKIIDDKKAFQQLEIAINKTFDKELSDYREEQRNKELAKEAAAKKKTLDELEKSIQIEKQIALAKVELLEDDKNNVLTLEEEKALARLKIEKSFLQQKIEFAKITEQLSSEEIELLELQIEKLNDAISKVEGVDLNPLEKLKADLLDAFGINEEEFQIIQEQAAKALQAVTQMLQANIDQQLEANERLIDGIQERIDTIQEKLEYEQEKRADGAGHSVSTLEAQLKKENELLEKAEKERIALEKEALRLRLAQQAAEVASNIGLAIAQLVATQSKFGIAGIITAAAGVASIFALIKSAKAQASQLSQPDKFEEGGKIGGKLHRDGGTIIEAERDEIVINRKDATEHEKFLLALNKGKYKNVDIPSLLEGKKGLAVPVDFVGQTLPSIQMASRELEQAIKINNQHNLENALRAVLPSSLQSQTTDIVNAIKGQKTKVAYQQAGKTKILSEWKEGNTTVRDILTINE